MLAFFGLLSHWNLLALTFCIGLGNAMNAPAWHAIVPEIVSGPQLRPAIALNSAGFNLARTVGPVVGQILLGLVGVFLLFAINAGTYIGVIFAMSSWKRPAEARASQRREGFVEAARTGIAFVRNSGELKAVFARGLCFFTPGIAIGTLLPVIGRFELGLDEFAFGILYAAFGVGAVAAAMMMPLINRLLGPDRANIWAMGIHAAVDSRRCTRHDALRRRRLRGALGRLLDHRHRQQRRLGADDPAQLHAGARHGGTPDGVFRLDGRGLAAVGQDRHLARHAGRADPLGGLAGALHRARRVDPTAALDVAAHLSAV